MYCVFTFEYVQLENAKNEIYNCVTVSILHCTKYTEYTMFDESYIFCYLLVLYTLIKLAMFSISV